MAKVVKVKVGKKAQKLDEAGLVALPRKTQIEVAIRMGLRLRRGMSKRRLAMVILANG